MDRQVFRLRFWSGLREGSFLIGLCLTTAGDALAQTSRERGSQSSSGEASTPRPEADSRAIDQPPGAVPGAVQPRVVPSEAYRESIRQTVERRRQRRANRGPGTGDPRPIGAIVPWLMPPALIIRHTPQVHDEIENLLELLRK